MVEGSPRSDVCRRSRSGYGRSNASDAAAHGRTQLPVRKLPFSWSFPSVQIAPGAMIAAMFRRGARLDLEIFLQGLLPSSRFLYALEVTHGSGNAACSCQRLAGRR